uniref:Uncharacterized protein n=1 Tax=uncultured marine group II/III euryarchaeote KM3_27_D07 TaxID=1456429 RepID=A0A075GWJ7_9EURY|nr:hypothetical protein [uncultured marine group II/III euryarchaeote KM3_27_D07]
MPTEFGRNFASHHLIPILLLSVIIIPFVLNPVASSETSNDSCPLSSNDDCESYSSVDVVHQIELERDTEVGIISGDGNYFVTQNSLTSKYAIIDTHSLSKIEGYLIPGQYFSVDHNTYNLVITNDSECSFPTQSSILCELESLNLSSTYTSPESPDRYYYDEQSQYCQLRDYCRDDEDGLSSISISQVGSNKISPNGKYGVDMNQINVDSDIGVWPFWLNGEDDIDGLIMLYHIKRWNINQSGIETDGAVGILIGEHHIIANEVDETEDVRFTAWAPNSQSLYVITTEEIGVFSSISGGYDRLYTWPDDNGCTGSSSDDSVDFIDSPHEISLDGSTLIFICGGKIQVVHLANDDMSVFVNVFAMLFVIATLLFIYIQRHKLKRLFDRNQLTSIFLILMISPMLAGCISDDVSVKLPKPTSFSVDSAPNDSSMLAIVEASKETDVAKFGLNIWVETGEGGFWCNPVKWAWDQPGEQVVDEICAIYSPQDAYPVSGFDSHDWVLGNEHSESLVYCELDVCEYNITIYYLGEYHSTHSIIQFGAI